MSLHTQARALILQSGCPAAEADKQARAYLSFLELLIEILQEQEADSAIHSKQRRAS